MSLISKEFDGVVLSNLANPQEWFNKHDTSDYTPTDEEKTALTLIKSWFTLGDLTMQTPRVEFNDMSVLSRMQVDQMSFNTYQPNNGQPLEGDLINGWRSNAIRPVVRNKAISIAAHATARLIFPKIFAWDNQSDDQKEAAMVMEDLMEWAADQSNYSMVALRRVMAALTDPASIGYTEYGDIYQKVKRKKDANGKWISELEVDKANSGFHDVVVPCDELYIENFYEPDIQKQGFLIWRKVISFTSAQAKYANYENFKYVKPGVQLIYNDANQTFYQVYDTNMRPYDVEEVTVWNKSMDVKWIEVNGVLLTTADNPNPRLDKLYPFDKYGYELINNRCFYYKSLAFKLMHDANIVNTLYPMIIDGTYLNLMPPMINIGSEAIKSNVIAPGVVTTLDSPDADLKPITTSNNLKAGMEALFKVDESINESSQDPIQQGQAPDGGGTTAYEISRLEQNAATVLGLFIKMIADHVKQFGILRMGDILQYLTVADADKITDQPDLVYKTFLMKDKQSNGGTKSRKIKFDATLNDKPVAKKYGLKPNQEGLAKSYDILNEQGDTGQELYKVDPVLFRDLNFMVQISPDVLNPMSDDLERAYKLEAYDRAIQNPLIMNDHDAMEQITRDLLLGSNPSTKKDPDKYLPKQNPMAQMAPMPQGQPNLPNAGNAPLASLNKNSLPQNTSNSLGMGT